MRHTAISIVVNNEINRRLLLNQAKRVFKTALKESGQIELTEDFVNTLFESKTVAELKLYIKLSDNLKAIRAKCKV